MTNTWGGLGNKSYNQIKSVRRSTPLHIIIKSHIGINDNIRLTTSKVDYLD